MIKEGKGLTDLSAILRRRSFYIFRREFQWNDVFCKLIGVFEVEKLLLLKYLCDKTVVRNGPVVFEHFFLYR